MTKEEKEKKLWWYTHQLASREISFCPVLSGHSLERLKRNNPKGYALLQEYLELELEGK